MQDVDLFIHSAEIAGVFVGFGALIAVRSGATMAVEEVNDIRWVVTAGIWVVVVALAPVFIAGYGVGGHGLWLASSVLALGFLAAVIVVFGRTSENRAEVQMALGPARSAADRARMVLDAALAFWLPTVGLVVALGVVVLGLLPDQEQALYLTAVGLGLLMAALTLFYVVVQPSSAASRQAGPPRS